MSNERHTFRYGTEAEDDLFFDREADDCLSPMLGRQRAQFPHLFSDDDDGEV